MKHFVLFNANENTYYMHFNNIHYLRYEEPGGLFSQLSIICGHDVKIEIKDQAVAQKIIEAYHAWLMGAGGRIS